MSTRKRIVKITLNQLLNQSEYKNFSVDGLRNIIGNILNVKEYDQLEGKNAEEKAIILYNKFNYVPKTPLA